MMLERTNDIVKSLVYHTHKVETGKNFVPIKTDKTQET